MDEPQQSLIDRMAQRLSTTAEPAAARRTRTVDWRFALALASVIALGPLITIVAADLIARDVRSDAARLRATAEPRIAAARGDSAARALLQGALAQPGVATWIDRAAQILPADARVSRMTRNANGSRELDVVAPDPDLVRRALRRAPAFAGFREISQRRAGAMILITYRWQA